MLDLKYVVNNLETVKTKLQHRKAEDQLEPIIQLDERRRTLIGEVEALRREQNENNEKIQQILKNEGPKSEAMQATRTASKELSQRIKELEPELKEIESPPPGCHAYHSQPVPRKHSHWKKRR